MASSELSGVTQLPITPWWPHEEQILDGPRSYESIACGDFAKHMTSLATPEHFFNAVGKLADGVDITSSFSGIGPDAIAVGMIENAIWAHAGLDEQLLAGMSIYSACDNDESCQSVLTAHGACHVFEDLEHLVPAEDISRLKQRLAAHRAVVDDEIDENASLHTRNSVKQREGNKFMQFAETIARKHV